VHNTLNEVSLYYRPSIRYPTERREKLLIGLQQLVWVLKKNTNVHVVSDGYKRCGQWPLNYDRAMSQCPVYHKLTAQQGKDMLAAVDAMVNIIRARGVVTEAEMDNLKIPKAEDDNRQVPKDQRVLHQQRAVLMSGDECIRAYKARKIATSDAKLQKNEKQQAKLERELMGQHDLTSEEQHARRQLHMNTVAELKREQRAAAATAKREAKAAERQARIAMVAPAIEPVTQPPPPVLELDQGINNDLGVAAAAPRAKRPRTDPPPLMDPSPAEGLLPTNATK
jgi:hypothetical protein